MPCSITRNPIPRSRSPAPRVTRRYCRRMLIGYARVSTAEQNPAHQIDALIRAGVAPDDVHVDHASGAKASRPQLDLVLKLLRAGDTLVITRLDRLGRSVLHLCFTVKRSIAAPVSSITQTACSDHDQSTPAHLTGASSGLSESSLVVVPGSVLSSPWLLPWCGWASPSRAWLPVGH